MLRVIDKNDIKIKSLLQYFENGRTMINLNKYKNDLIEFRDYLLKSTKNDNAIVDEYQLVQTMYNMISNNYIPHSMEVFIIYDTNNKEDTIKEVFYCYTYYEYLNSIINLLLNNNIIIEQQKQYLSSHINNEIYINKYTFEEKIKKINNAIGTLYFITTSGAFICEENKYLDLMTIIKKIKEKIKILEIDIFNENGTINKSLVDKYNESVLPLYIYNSFLDIIDAIDNNLLDI